jgi:4-amino-4-deoxy-L-arabinose transferase-like glycosyltransferase
MNEFVYALSTIIFCVIGYFTSWLYYKKQNYEFAILLIILCGFALRLYTSCDFYLHAWDERYHALVAKNLIKHPFKPTLYDIPILNYDFKNWTTNHIWLHKQPLPLWLMSCSMKVFGVNEIALRLPSIVASTISIWLSYYIGTYFFSKKNGYLTAYFFSINGLIIELTSGRVATDHIDIFFLFFIELAIVFCILFIKRSKAFYTILAGFSIGAAILSKWLPALIVFPIWLLLIKESNKFKTSQVVFQLILLIAACCLVFTPWQIYIYNLYPNEYLWEANFNLKHFFEALEGHEGNYFYFIEKIRINYNELVYLPLIWFLYKIIKVPSNKKNTALFIWIFLPLLFFSIASTKMQGYILFISPALFIITAEFFYVLYDYKKANNKHWIFSLLIILFIALPIRYMIERVKPFEFSKRETSWANDLRNLNKYNFKKGVLFNYDKPVEAMFYTNLVAYNFIPNLSTISKLKNAGYLVIINDNGNLPFEIKNDKGILFEKIRN